MQAEAREVDRQSELPPNNGFALLRLRAASSLQPGHARIDSVCGCTFGRCAPLAGLATGLVGRFAGNGAADLVSQPLSRRTRPGNFDYLEAEWGRFFSLPL